MKKLFTFIFATALAVSCWGTVVTIGGSSSSTDSNFPIIMTAGVSSSITQQIYLKSEFTSQSITSGSITSISFYYSSSTPTEYKRNLEIWIMEKNTSSFTGTYFDATSSTVKSPGTKCFDGEITIPAQNGWYDIPLTNAFNWKGNNNVIVTIYDKSTSPTGNFKKHKVVSATNRGKYTSSISKAITQIWDQTGTTASTIPAIKFTFAGGEPEPEEPELNATCASPDFGTFAKEYETRSTTITVTGKNLTEDVTISAADGMTVDPASLTKEAVMATGGAVVTVTTNSSFVSGKKVTISGDKIEKTVTFTGTEATFIERSGYTFLYTSDLGSYSLLVGPTEIASVDASAQTFVLGTTSQACTIDYSAVSGTFLAKGKISNLKVKKTGEGLFKAFTFNYTAPVVSGITIYENADNSAILAENDGQTVDIKFIRSFTKDMYNTICLPISIGEAIVENMFGTGYSLVELTSSTFENEAINLVFTGKKAIEAGKPYLIKPKKDVTDPQFTNYLVSKNLNTTTTTYADFIPTFSPTDLSQSENILFLGTGDELFYPAQAGTLKGLRCYFLIKGTTNAPVRMQINKDNSITEIIEIQSTNATRKTLVNGQIVILRGEKKYTINGQKIK